VRVLYFSDNSSDHNRRFLEQLSLCGHEVWFLDITSDRLHEGWLPPGVRSVQPKHTFQRDSDPSVFEEFLSEFRALVKDLQPDLLHAGPVQTCAYVAALSGFHPLLVMSWGADLLMRADRNAEWKHATEIALRGADGFFCDCDTVRAMAQRIVALSDSRIAQFPWGIKRGSFSPVGPLPPRESLPFEPVAIKFICTRAWEPLYDVDVLLEAFRWAHSKNNLLRLLLLGNGSEADRIRNFIAEHGLREVVCTPGMVPGREVPNWFRAASTYVSCARSDGTSISLLEAMATGLPVVVTDIPSNREWVSEDENGWLASASCPEEFGDKLLRAAGLKPTDRATISERNQRIVARRADWDGNFPILLRLYELLVVEKRGIRA
jgi:glycosyltransferase involved in cell wall biosynthesis